MSTETRPLAHTTDDRAVAIRRYRQGDHPKEIADALESDLATVSKYIRETGVLAPWDDHRALSHLYHDCGFASANALAELFDGQRSAEAIRTRMDTLDVSRHDSLEAKLLAMDPGEIDGLSPLRETDRPTPDDRDGQLDLSAFGGGSE